MKARARLHSWVWAFALALAGGACRSTGPVTWEDVGAPSASARKGLQRERASRDAPKREDPKPPQPHPQQPQEPQQEPRSAPMQHEPTRVAPVAAAPMPPQPMEVASPTRSAPVSAPSHSEPSLLAAPLLRSESPRPDAAVQPISTSDIDVLGARASDGDVISVEALTLVCVADARALTETTLAFARLEDEAQKQGVTLAPSRVVRLSRDPARSLSDPPPRACRPQRGDATLKAPLLRERADAGAWLVSARTSGDIVDDAARAALRLGRGKHSAVSAPMVLMDADGERTAIVQPVTAAGGS